MRVAFAITMAVFHVRAHMAGDTRTITIVLCFAVKMAPLNEIFYKVLRDIGLIGWDHVA